MFTNRRPNRFTKVNMIFIRLLPVFCPARVMGNCETNKTDSKAKNQKALVTVQQDGLPEIHALRKSQLNFKFEKNKTCLGLYADVSSRQDTEGVVKIVGSSFGGEYFSETIWIVDLRVKNIQCIEFVGIFTIKPFFVELRIISRVRSVLSDISRLVAIFLLSATRFKSISFF